MPTTATLLFFMFSGEKGKPGRCYGPLLDLDLVLANTKLFSCVSFLAIVDCSVVCLCYPWKVSEFTSKTGGYPNMTIFLVTGGLKLVQSSVTVLCQAGYLVIVNRSGLMGKLSSTSVAYLVINLALNALLVLLNIFEFVLMREVIASQKLKIFDPSSSQSSSSNSNSPSRPLSSRFSTFLSRISLISSQPIVGAASSSEATTSTSLSTSTSTSENLATSSSGQVDNNNPHPFTLTLNPTVVISKLDAKIFAHEAMMKALWRDLERQNEVISKQGEWIQKMSSKCVCINSCAGSSCGDCEIVVPTQLEALHLNYERQNIIIESMLDSIKKLQEEKR